MEEIKTYEPKQDYKVLCHCITYNQAPYITDTMNGFTMQKTTFPFACWIIDDASTDGEQEVIKAYLNENFDMDNSELLETELANTIIAKHKTNENCTFAVYLLKRNLWHEPKLKYAHITPWRDHCEYEALCEGDDYWIAEDKLQKQVNWMSENPEYTMCFTNALERYEDPSIADHYFSFVENKDYKGIELFENWIVPTASVLLKPSIYKSEIYGLVKLDSRFIYGDLPIFLTCAHLGKIRGFSDVMTVYRRACGGITSNRSAQQITRIANYVIAIADTFGEELRPHAVSSYCRLYFEAFIMAVKEGNLRVDYILTPFKKYPYKYFCAFFNYLKNRLVQRSK